MKHDPLRVLVPVLLTCATCHGATTYHDPVEGLCACACENGYVSVALQPADVVAAAALPSPEARHAFLLHCAKTEGRVRHPLLYNSVQTPASYQTPLRPNPSDAKRKIPLQ